jgi:hypothetical protein
MGDLFTGAGPTRRRADSLLYREVPSSVYREAGMDPSAAAAGEESR